MIYLAIIALTAAVFLAVAIICAFRAVQILVMGERGKITREEVKK